METRCSHCDGKGKCISAQDESSCDMCVRNGTPIYAVKNWFFSERKYGYICKVCDGSGDHNIRTKRFHEWLVPYLALFIVLGCFGLIIEFKGSDNFAEVLAFSTTLIGSITGYYFRGVISSTNKLSKRDDAGGALS